MSSLIVLIPVLAIFAWAGISYNRLIFARACQADAWGRVAAQLSHRADLIPVLAACCGQAHAVLREDGQIRMEADVVKEMRALLATAEEDSELGAGNEFRSLIARLARVEGDLHLACADFNRSVRDFQNLVRSFPANILAGIFGFQAAEVFEAESVAPSKKESAGVR